MTCEPERKKPSGLPIGSRIYETDGLAPTLQAAKSPNRGGTDGPLILIPEPAASSPVSADSTSDSTGPGGRVTPSEPGTGET